MKSRRLTSDGEQSFVLVFATGDEVMAGLLAFARERTISAGRFTAIGALSDVVSASGTVRANRVDGFPQDRPGHLPLRKALRELRRRSLEPLHPRLGAVGRGARHPLGAEQPGALQCDTGSIGRVLEEHEVGVRGLCRPRGQNRGV